MSTGDVHRSRRKPWIEALVVALTTLAQILVLQWIWDVRWQWMASVVVVVVFICLVPALVIYLRRERPERVSTSLAEMTSVRPSPPTGGGAGSQGRLRPLEGAGVVNFDNDRPATPIPVPPLVEPTVYRWADTDGGDAPPRTEIIGPPVGSPIPPERYPNGGHRP